MSTTFDQDHTNSPADFIRFAASFALILLIAVVALFPGVNYAPVALFGGSIGLFVKAMAPDFTLLPSK